MLVLDIMQYEKKELVAEGGEALYTSTSLGFNWDDSEAVGLRHHTVRFIAHHVLPPIAS